MDWVCPEFFDQTPYRRVWIRHGSLNATPHHGWRRHPVSDVFHRLRDDIISCVLKPGEKLKFEILRTIYGVSFSTLREALSRLTSEGLVEVKGQHGFRVRPVSPKDLTDITDLRVMIEMEAIRLAISAATRIGKPSCSRRTIAWTASRRGMASATS